MTRELYDAPEADGAAGDVKGADPDRPVGGPALSPAPQLRPRLRMKICSAAVEDDGTRKDQDAFHAAPNGSFACVADGVSTSAFGGEAAQMAVQ